eukprot:3989256-Prorocentrum_lima.AAC.1
MQDPDRNPVLIAVAPVEQDILFISQEYWITPEWTFYGLPEHLEALLTECKSCHAQGVEVDMAPTQEER